MFPLGNEGALMWQWLHQEPRSWQPDRTIPNPVPIGPAPSPGKRGSRGLPREAVGGPHHHHPDDRGGGRGERQGSDGGFGDVVGVGVLTCSPPLNRRGEDFGASSPRSLAFRSPLPDDGEGGGRPAWVFERSRIRRPGPGGGGSGRRHRAAGWWRGNRLTHSICARHLPVALFSNGRVALPSAAGRPGTHTPRSLRSRSQARLATPIVRTGGGRRSGWGGATATPPGFKLRPRA